MLVKQLMRKRKPDNIRGISRLVRSLDATLQDECTVLVLRRIEESATKGVTNLHAVLGQEYDWPCSAVELPRCPALLGNMSKMAGAASLATSGYLSRDLVPTATCSPIFA
ncbi:hypothetical protein F442_16257 [Phytophthora nicotianae P10297]|uniref:Uncharacterized protein n=6 Tax=Phytophthora nicotianae TaxID=4792 RepID=V9EEP6_PHYNI|nr:hypothetical protein F443_16414 [Phytophthora nicotianae P1569]ETK77955.1 hypothetical protein L915_15952 [Phytophthora nicotianae]ETM37748.1 hypothetical protein L914_15782 [Phytophthora nicotianae]ETP35626.1 hypothetical protein F442_16257 [Phytophthora nicotianae P10297]